MAERWEIGLAAAHAAEDDRSVTARVLAAACELGGEFTPAQVLPGESRFKTVEALHRLEGRGHIERLVKGVLQWTYRATDAGRARDAAARTAGTTPPPAPRSHGGRPSPSPGGYRGGASKRRSGSPTDPPGCDA